MGWGKQMVKVFGLINAQVCGHCNNMGQRSIVKITTWFTLFFIPIIPYRTRYLLICPVCRDSIKISKEEFKHLIQNGTINVHDEYAGKTETQIAYLKAMKEMNESKSSEESPL